MDDTMKKDNLAGLRGWLILVGIGIVIAPLIILAEVIPSYVTVFTPEVWAALTTPGSEFYHPLMEPFIWGELIVNTGLILTSFYLIFLFFTKKQLFPKIFIALTIVSLVLILVDAAFFKLIMPEEPFFDPETLKQFMRSAVACAIWVPYMLFSQRVKATFVN